MWLEREAIICTTASSEEEAGIAADRFDKNVCGYVSDDTSTKL